MVLTGTFPLLKIISILDIDWLVLQIRNGVQRSLT